MSGCPVGRRVVVTTEPSLTLPSGSERWWVLVGCGLSFGGYPQHGGALVGGHARWPGDPGDAAGCGDREDAVGGHGVAPAGGVGLQPVVPAAQAAEGGAVGLAAAGGRDHVVQIGPAGPVAAAGMPAAAVPGAAEPL